MKALTVWQPWASLIADGASLIADGAWIACAVNTCGGFRAEAADHG